MPERTLVLKVEFQTRQPKLNSSNSEVSSKPSTLMVTVALTNSSSISSSHPKELKKDIELQSLMNYFKNVIKIETDVLNSMNLLKIIWIQRFSYKCVKKIYHKELLQQTQKYNKKDKLTVFITGASSLSSSAFSQVNIY